MWCKSTCVCVWQLRAWGIMPMTLQRDLGQRQGGQGKHAAAQRSSYCAPQPTLAYEDGMQCISHACHVAGWPLPAACGAAEAVRRQLGGGVRHCDAPRCGAAPTTSVPVAALYNLHFHCTQAACLSAVGETPTGHPSCTPVRRGRGCRETHRRSCTMLQLSCSSLQMIKRSSRH